MPPSAHIALARKWRPQRFEDVIGQRGVVETLRNAIASGRVAQSFIFAGPRGVGKTTTARIVARALNCVKGPTAEPCGECDACVEIAAGRDVDVMEIDAATYTGIDAVREVIVEPLGIAPMRDRFKIFIIDEVHRLSKQAFDALLKSIEEPPPYVKFMMATTELHAVPATIQSRSQLFELKSLSFAAIRDELKKVAGREQVTIDEAAIALVARSAEGSMRDALSALDQVMAFTTDTVSATDVSTVLGLIARDVQFEVAEIVAREDVAAAFAVANTIVEAGLDLRIVCRELARLMRDLLVILIDPTRVDDPEIAGAGERDRLKALAVQFSREDLLRAFDLLSRAEFDIRNSSQPRHHFEMALVKWIQLRHLTPLTELIAGLEGGGAPSPALARPRASAPPAATPAVARPSATAPPAATTAPARPPQARPAPPAPVPSQVRPTASAPPAAKATAASDDFLARFQSSVKDSNKVFSGMVLAQARIEVDGDSLVFTFAPAHKSLKVQLEAKRSWLEQVAQSVSGRRMTVVAKESAAVAAAPASSAASDTKRDELRARAKAEPTVQAVLDVFGGEIEDVEEIE